MPACCYCKQTQSVITNLFSYLTHLSSNNADNALEFNSDILFAYFFVGERLY